MSKKHLITFGHSPNGSPDPGTTSGSLKEAIEIRRLEPYLKKWAEKSKDKFDFYQGNMFADRSISKQTGYDTVTELHLDGPKGSGGHVIIFRAFKPDTIDHRLKDLIERHWGIVGYLQNTNGFSYRSNLYNLNEAARLGINYRLLELFFVSNDGHRQHYLDNLDLIAKEMIESITGEGLDGSVEHTKDVKPAPKPAQTPKKSAREVANDILTNNTWGNGDVRKRRLEAKGYNYNEVQDIVNDIIRGRASSKKTAQQVAQEIADGKGGWGNDPQRSRKLRAAGYDARDVQRRVNDIIRKREGVQSRPSPIRSSGPRVGQTITTRTLYANSASTKNLRSSPVKGYIHSINNNWRNPIRLTNGKNGNWLGFTRPGDIL